MHGTRKPPRTVHFCLWGRSFLMSLQIWNPSVNKKEDWFIYTKIETLSELNTFIDENCKRTLLFRGINDASYKQYSSIQRFWDSNSFNCSFHGFVKKAIQNGAAIYNKYFNVDPQSELTILSFLQHYGFPTPVLDFTTKFDTALFFATDKVSLGSKNGDYTDYISIYALIPYQQDLCNFREIIDNDSYPCPPECLNNYDIAKGWDRIIVLNDLDANSGDFLLGLGNNPNIAAQNGLFILNPQLSQTLDEVFNGETFEKFGETGPEDVIQTHDELFYGKMICWDINKSLISDIQNYLTTKGVSSNSIYPDANHKTIAKELEELRDSLALAM